MPDLCYRLSGAFPAEARWKPSPDEHYYTQNTSVPHCDPDFAHVLNSCGDQGFFTWSTLTRTFLQVVSEYCSDHQKQTFVEQVIQTKWDLLPLEHVSLKVAASYIRSNPRDQGQPLYLSFSVTKLKPENS